MYLHLQIIHLQIIGDKTMNTLQQNLYSSVALNDAIEGFPRGENDFFDSCHDTFEYLADVEARYFELFGKILPFSLYKSICNFYVTHLTSPVNNN
jgi:hypothetical protein